MFKITRYSLLGQCDVNANAMAMLFLAGVINFNLSRVVYMHSLMQFISIVPRKIIFHLHHSLESAYF